MNDLDTSLVGGQDNPKNIEVSGNRQLIRANIGQVVIKKAETINGEAGQDLVIGDVVRWEADQLVLASQNDEDSAEGTLGIVVVGGLNGESVQVMKSGTVQASGWSWTQNRKVYLGLNGTITQTMPTTGFILTLGFATQSNEIELDIEFPIWILEE